IFTMLLLAGITFENFYTYFIIQTNLTECVADSSWSESKTGRLIAALPPNTQCFLPTIYYGHPTVLYLTYPGWNKVHQLDISRPPMPASFPKDSSFCFLLDSFKMGTLLYLETLYPGGQVATFRDPLGEISIYTYLVPSRVLEKLTNQTIPKKGLVGVYRHSPDQKEQPFLKRRDPLLNFNFRDLTMTGTPLFIHWNGRFKADKKGVYQFGVILFGSAKGNLLIDRKKLGGYSERPFWQGELKKGWHQFQFDYQDPGSSVAQVNLLWKPPGKANFDFMPNQVFGEIKE
ncbi:MAG TPA: hypothetical protein VK791_04770, partial [bacterium]|nr:hypothetical protein [bacterium]